MSRYVALGLLAALSSLHRAPTPVCRIRKEHRLEDVEVRMAPVIRDPLPYGKKARRALRGGQR